jgi:hypothetical protein
MEKFKILALDGGGVRGYLSILILEKIEQQLNRYLNENIPIGMRFDLIAGTSTGSIIATMLALGKTAKEIKELYEHDIPIIFGKKMKRWWPLSFTHSKYKNDMLVAKAKDYFGDLTFIDVKRDLIITSVDVTTMTPRLHKSDYASRNLSRLDETLANAVVSSCSAPAFFKVARYLKHSDFLIDGGIVANNPSMIAIIDALHFERPSKKEIPIPTTLNDVLLLSIGTGNQCETPFDLKPLEDASFDWLMQFPLGKYGFSMPLIEILMASQSKLTEYQSKFLLDHAKAQSRRINPQLSFKMKLDDFANLGKLKNIADLSFDDVSWLQQNFKKDQQ